jgi:hypothetical protein
MTAAVVRAQVIIREPEALKFMAGRDSGINSLSSKLLQLISRTRVLVSAHMPTSKPNPPSQKNGTLPPKSSIPPTSTSSVLSQTLLRWTGFTKSSNLILFSLTAGTFAIFSALQTRTLDEGNRIKPNPPGGPFWFKEGLLYFAMQAHLWSVIRKYFLLKCKIT